MTFETDESTFVRYWIWSHGNSSTHTKVKISDCHNYLLSFCSRSSPLDRAARQFGGRTTGPASIKPIQFPPNPILLSFISSARNQINRLHSSVEYSHLVPSLSTTSVTTDQSRPREVLLPHNVFRVFSTEKERSRTENIKCYIIRPCATPPLTRKRSSC